MKKMKRTRRKFSNEFKAKVAIEAIKERERLAKLALRYELHQNQISQWKQEFLKNSNLVFEGNNAKADKSEEETEKLYTKIGRLEMERDFLKKLNQIGTFDMKRKLIDKEEPLSLNCQLSLLNLSKGGS